MSKELCNDTREVDQMFRIICDTITKYSLLARGDRVVVAVSGGPDSVALTHVLFSLKKEYDLVLHIAHLNHMFRGAEADQDARWVMDLAQQLEIPCTVSKVDVPAFAKARRISAQAAARQVRYDFLEQVRMTQKATRIATGHHADDQAETLVMNILRGAGPGGLSGIPPQRGGVYIRPLIDATREEIENYCRENELAYCQDSSNFKPVYLRNRVRLELLPLLEREYNPEIRVALIRLAGIMQDENEFMDTQVQDLWDKLMISDTRSEIICNLPGFLAAPPALQRRLLRKAWAALRGDARELTYNHLEQAMNFLRDGKAGGVIEFPRHIIMINGYGEFRLTVARPNLEPVVFCYALQIPGTTFIPEIGANIVVEITGVPPVDAAGKKELWVDAEKLSGPLQVRSRQSGDRFWPLGGRGSKKIKEFFIDAKVPRRQRDRVPIITAGEDIVWVGGMRPDDRWQITDSTRKFLHLKILENITEQN